MLFRSLIGKKWREVAETIWTADDEGYAFKKSHAVAYAHLVCVHMNLVSEAVDNILLNINNINLLNELNDYKFINESIHSQFMSDNVYKRKIIYSSEQFDIILIEWEINSFTKIHDHPEKGCIVKILDGILYEENFDRSLYLMNINTLKKNDIGYKIGNNILHRIICKKPAKSLHIYIPGNYKCNYF